MSRFEKEKIEKEFLAFASRNFETPKRCRNAGQVRFYVRELCIMIEDLKQKFNYVPKRAYALLTEYNCVQNKMVSTNFLEAYG